MEGFEYRHDLLRVFGIQIAGRLVGQQDGRAIHDGAGDAQSLLFAAGQRDGIGFFALEQPYFVECGAHPLVAFAVIEAADLQRQQHVVERVAVEQQLVILKDDAEVAAQVRQRAAFEHTDVLMVDQHAAVVGSFDRGDEFEQGALARARVSGEEHHLALGDFERDVLQRLIAARVTFVDLVEGDHASRPNSAATKSSATKGRRSSSPSPTPMNRTGIGCALAIAAITPPLAVPSSLVSISPVTPSA